MHTGNPFEPKSSAPSAEVSLPELDKILALHFGANSLSESGFCDQVAAREDLLGRSGLLTQGSSQRASFFHLSFQEFLAAEQLTRLADGLDKLLQVIFQRANMANWRPTLRFLLARRATEKTPEAVLELLEQMLTRIDVDDVRKFTGLTLSVVDGLEILLDRNLHLQGDARDQFVNVFLKSIEQNVEVKARAELALMLGRLGDPRVSESLVDSNAWVTVSPGTYIYGGKDEKFEIERPFGISKFPVTNAQFAAFVTDGYQTESQWHPAGWAWRSSNNITQPEYWDDSKWNGATCPVVGVSWWEADAFCRWAKVRLPAECEWEAVARGPAGLKYPWGNEDRIGLCNSNELGLSRTSAVGIFPPSVSHCGAHDMAGNVWEWCSDHYDPAEQKDDNAGRVLRGGSWSNQADDGRSAIRYLRRPDFRSHNFGFRVARTL